MALTHSQISILECIAATRPVSADDATWAVTEGLAVQAEDGDIDLTSAGRAALDQVQDSLSPLARGPAARH